MPPIKLVSSDGKTNVISVPLRDKISTHIRQMRERVGYPNGTKQTKWKIQHNGKELNIGNSFIEQGISEGDKITISLIENKKSVLELATAVPGGGSANIRRYNFPTVGKVDLIQKWRHEGSGTGSIAWDAAFILAAVIDKNPFPPNQPVIELGAGIGLPSVVSSLSGSKIVIASDGDPSVLSLLKKNISNSCKGSPVTESCLLQWGDVDQIAALQQKVSSSLKQLSLPPDSPPIIIASDVLYRGSAKGWSSLIITLKIILSSSDGSRALISATLREGVPDKRFFAMLDCDPVLQYKKLPTVEVGSILHQKTELYEITKKGDGHIDPMAGF